MKIDTETCKKTCDSKFSGHSGNRTKCKQACTQIKNFNKLQKYKVICKSHCDAILDNSTNKNKCKDACDEIKEKA